MHCEQSEVWLWKKTGWRVWSIKHFFKSLSIVAHPWIQDVLLLVLFISYYFLITCLLQKCLDSSLPSYVILCPPQPEMRLMCSPHYILFHLFSYFHPFRQCFVRICPNHFSSHVFCSFNISFISRWSLLMTHRLYYCTFSKLVFITE